MSKKKGSPQPRGRLFDSLEQEAYLQLWRTYDRLREIEERVFAEFGINAQQYNVLRILRSYHPEAASTATLASRLVSRAPDMTRMLDKLDEMGCVVRQRSPSNRRFVEVAITAAGIEFLEEMNKKVRKCNEEQLGHLSEAKLGTLIELLKQAREPHESGDAETSWPGNY